MRDEFATPGSAIVDATIDAVILCLIVWSYLKVWALIGWTPQLPLFAFGSVLFHAWAVARGVYNNDVPKTLRAYWLLLVWAAIGLVAHWSPHE